MTALEMLSDANGTFRVVALVSGAHPDDLDHLRRYPGQQDRLRAVIPGEFDRRLPEDGVTHVLVYPGYEGHTHRIALARVDKPFPAPVRGPA